MEGFLPFTVIDLHTDTRTYTLCVLLWSIVKVISYAVEYLTNVMVSPPDRARKVTLMMTE